MKYTVIRDTREQEGWFFEPSDFFEDTITRKLDTGDYSLVGFERDLCIERKAGVAELAGNIGEDRFWREMERAQSYKYKFMIIECNFDKVLSFPKDSGIPLSKQKFVKVTNKFLLREITRIQSQYNFHVWFAGNSYGGYIAAHSIFKRVIENEK